MGKWIVVALPLLVGGCLTPSAAYRKGFKDGYERTAKEREFCSHQMEICARYLVINAQGLPCIKGTKGGAACIDPNFDPKMLEQEIEKKPIKRNKPGVKKK